MDPQLQTPPPQPPQSPPSVSSENSSRSFWKTLAIGMSIVSFGIAFAVGGYILGTNKNKTAEVSTAQIPSTPDLVDTESSRSATANWKTYTNERYGIEFKYPTVWVLDEQDAKHFVQINLSNGVPIQPPDYEVISCQPAIAELVLQAGISRKNEQTFEEFVNFQIENPVRGQPPAVKPEITQTTVGGHNAFKIRDAYNALFGFPTEMTGNCEVDFYYVEQNSNRYMTLSFIVNKNEDKLIIDQILSSFKFTDSSANVGMGCKIGGCSGQICQNETDEGAITTCEYKEEYACYKTAKCEKQANGKCGWTQTADLSSCLSSS